MEKEPILKKNLRHFQIGSTEGIRTHTTSLLRRMPPSIGLRCYSKLVRMRRIELLVSWTRTMRVTKLHYILMSRWDFLGFGF